MSDETPIFSVREWVKRSEAEMSWEERIKAALARDEGGIYPCSVCGEFPHNVREHVRKKLSP